MTVWSFLLIILVGAAAIGGMILCWVYARAVFPYAVILIALGTFLFFAWKGSGYRNDFVEPRALLAVLTIIAVGYGITVAASSSTFGNVFTGYLGLVFGVLSIVVMLALGWLQFGQQLEMLQQQPGMVGLIAQLVFALPCYLAWIAQYIVADFRSTAPATVLLFATEFALLAVYLFRKRIAAAAEAVMARVTDRTRGYITTPLQTERVFLNYETRLGNRPLPEGATAIITDPDTGTVTVDAANRSHTMLTPAQSLGQNQDYRISLELFMHPLEIGADSAAYSVLRYADGTTRRGCPSVFFEGGGVSKVTAVDNQRNAAQLQVYLTNAAADAKSPPVLIAIPMQRWIKLTFYYTRTQVDVIMDEKLVHSLVWTSSNRPTFGPGDRFILGSPMTGALGSLRNLSVSTPKSRSG